MVDDYVWDKSGEAEDDLLALERTLSTLRHSRPLGELVGPRYEAAARKSTWAAPMLLGAALSCALTLLLIWLALPILDGAGEPDVAAVPPSPAAVTAPPSKGAKAVAPSNVDRAAPSEADKAEIERLTRELRATLVALQAAVAEIEAMQVRTHTEPTRATPPTRAPASKTAAPVPSIDCILDPTRCAEPEPEPEPEPAVQGDSVEPDLGIDCILDPEACKPRKAKTKTTTKTRKSAAPLRDKLSSQDIKDGIAPHKAAAKACGVRHGALPGDKVVVKLSIEGATGHVTGATATGTHKSTPLGRCIAAELGKAQFPRFNNASLGVVYPILL